MALSEERRRRLEEEQRKAVQNNLRAAAAADAAKFDLLERQRQQSQRIDQSRINAEIRAQRRAQAEAYAAREEALTNLPDYRAYNREIWKESQRPQADLNYAAQRADRELSAAQRQRDRIRNGNSYWNRQAQAQEQKQYGSYMDRMSQPVRRDEVDEDQLRSEYGTDYVRMLDRSQSVQPDLNAASQYGQALGRRQDALNRAEDRMYYARQEKDVLERERDYARNGDVAQAVRRLGEAGTLDPNRVGAFDTDGKRIARDVYNSIIGNTGMISGQTDVHIDQMNDVEKATILNMAQDGKWTDIEKFTNALQATLDARWYDTQETRIAQMPTAAQVGYGMLGTFTAPAAYAQVAADTLTGRRTDPKSGAVGATRLTQEAREQSLANAGTVGRFVGNVAYSMADNLTTMALGPTGAIVWLGLSAAGNEAANALANGARQGQAFTKATVSGAIETATEKMGIDNLFDTVLKSGSRGLKNALKDIAKQFGSEGAEEIISEFANTFADKAIMGQQSEYNNAIRDYEASGLSHDDAVKRANLDFFVKNPALAGLAGALSGALFGIGGVATQRIRQGASDLAFGRDITNNRRIADVVLDEGMKSTDQRIRDEAYRLDAIRKENERSEGFQWSAADQRRIGEIYDSLDNDSKARVGQEAGIREAEREAEMRQKIAEQEARDQEERDRNMTPEEFDEEIRRRAEASGNSINMDNPETMVAEEPAEETEQTTRRGSEEYTDRVGTPEDVDADMRRRAAAAEEATRTGDRSALEQLDREPARQEQVQTEAAPQTENAQQTEPADQATRDYTPEQAARQTADNARRAGLSAEDTLVMSNIARDVGARLEFQQMRNSRIHGFYNRETGTIVLNQDLSTAEMAWSTFAHEITHHSETAGSYKQLAALAKRFVGETAGTGDEDDAWNSYIRQKRRQYADVGYYTSQQDAEFEAVANTIENILTSREAMEGVVRYSREDAQALLASIDDVLDRSTTNSTAITPESARLVQAQKALAAALGEVREQRTTQTESATATQTTGNSPDSEGTTMVMDNDTPIKQYSISTTIEPLGLEFTKDENGKTILLDKNGKAVDNVTKDMVMNSDYGALIRATTKTTDNPNGVITEKEADAEAQFLADTIQLMLKTQDIDLIWAVNSAIGFNPIKPGEVAKATKAKGKFAALTSNSDPQYGTTIDFTTICKKTQAVIDVMSETMKRTHKGLTSDEVIKIVYDEVAKAGEPVPCPVCYVFSRWVGLGGLFDSMNNMQNQYPVGMDVSEIRSDIASLKKRIEAFAGKNFSDKKSKFYKNLVNEQAALEKKKFDAENLGEEPLTSAENERLETITKQIRYIDQWTWLTKVRLNKNYEKQGFVPPDILFDINAGKKFAESYPLAWKYRTSRGPAMGKAATPYADEHIGQIIRGIAVPNSVKKHQLGDLTRDPFLGTEGELGSTALKTLSMAQANARKQNMLNGQRLQSTSDFRYEYALDYLMAFFELQSIGSKAQMYTKVPEMISMAASCGLEVNCSLMPLNDGYDENDNLIFSDVTGMNAEDAFRYSAIYNCVQPIIVGINPKHVRLCMRDPRITFCIPFHASGGTEDNYVSMMQSVDETVTNRTDFSHYQNDTVMADATPDQKAAYSARLKILTGKAGPMTAAETNAVRNNEILSQLHARLYGTDVDGNAASVDDMYLNPDDRGSGRDSETYQTFLTSDQAEKIMPYEFWDKNATRDNERVNGDRFVKYCESLGVHARFSGWSDTGTYNPEMDFTNEDGYWKVIPDRKMYNNDGTYHVQQAVNISNFQAEYLLPSEADKNIVKPSRANDRSKVSDIADKAWARISEARANESSKYSIGYDQEAIDKSNGKVQYSLDTETEQKYEDAVKSGDEDTAQYYVGKAALNAGAITKNGRMPLKLYHGTTRFGFTTFDTSRTKYNTGAIFTSTNEGVASGYSNFGRTRPVSSRYVQDDGTDATLIRNAKNILNADIHHITDTEVEDIRQKFIKQAKQMAEAEKKALHESEYAPPDEIFEAFWETVQAFTTVVEEDEGLFYDDLDYRDEYKKKLSEVVKNDYGDMWREVREYYNNNDAELERLKSEGKPYYDMLFSNPEHAERLIDIDIVYKKLLQPEDAFVYAKPRFLGQAATIDSREDLLARIEHEKDEGKYALYGFAGDKPLDIDAGGNYWTNIKVPIIGEGVYDTDYIAKWAKKNGYTSVAIRNVLDPGIVNERGDDYIFFNSEQLKSADPVVYDDNGNVIPLSERFNPDNKDIRYALAGNDWEADVKEAVRRYGRMKPGEQLYYTDKNGKKVKATDESYLPKGTSEDTRIRGFQRTAIESRNVKADTRDLAVANQYRPTSNEENIQKAIERRGNGSFDLALGEWNTLVKSGRLSYKNLSVDIAFGERLLLEAQQEGNVDAVRSIITDLAEIGTTFGQATQAFSLLKRMSPEGQLIQMEREGKNYYDKLNRKGKYTNKKAARQVKYTDDLGKAADAMERLDEAKKQLSDIQKDKNNTAAQIKAAKAKIASINNEIKQALAELSKTKQDWKHTKGILNLDQLTRRELNSEIKATKDRIQNALDEIKKTQTDIDRLQGELWALENKEANKKADRDALREKRKELKRQRDNMMSRIETLSRQIPQLQADIDAMFSQMAIGEDNEADMKSYRDTLRESRDIMTDYLRYVKQKGTVVIPTDLSNEYINAKTDEERAAVQLKIDRCIADQLPGTWEERIRAVRYISMLFNPTTHLRNISGNAMQYSMVKARDVFATLGEKAFLRNGEERYHAFLSSKKGADAKYWDAADADYKEMMDIVQGNRTDVGAHIEEMRRIFKTDFGEKIRRTSGETLEAEDRFWLSRHYKSAFAQYLKANKLDPANLTDEQLDRARSIAVDQAQKATYRDYSTFADQLNRLEKSSGAAEFIMGGLMPFKKTPINVLKRGVEYSPLGAIKTAADFIKLKRGNTTVTAADVINDAAQTLTGTLATTLGVLLGAMGWAHASPGEDENKKKKNFDKETGMQNYSIEIPGYDENGNWRWKAGTYTVDWLSPFSMPLFIGVRIAEMVKGQDSGLHSYEDIVDAASSIAEPIFQLSMLDGLTSALQSYQTSGAGVSRALLWSVVESYALQFFPTLGSKMARIIDPTQRSTKAFKYSTWFGQDIERLYRRILAKIPGATYALKPVIDQHGDIKKNVGSNVIERIGYNLTSPGYYKYKSTDEADAETRRVYEALAGEDPELANSVLPRDINTYWELNGEKYYLNAEEYRKFSETQGKEETAGRKELYASDAYRNATDAEKAAMIKKVIDAAQEKAKIGFFEDIGVDNDYYRSKLNDSVYNKDGSPKNLQIVTDMYENGSIDLGTIYQAEKAMTGITKTGAKIDTLNQMIQKYNLTQDEYDFLYMTKIANQYMQDDMQAVLDAGGTLDQAINTVARFYKWDANAVDSKTGETGMWVSIGNGAKAEELAKSNMSLPAIEAMYLALTPTDDVDTQTEIIDTFKSAGKNIKDYLNTKAVLYDGGVTKYKKTSDIAQAFLDSDLPDDLKELGYKTLGSDAQGVPDEIAAFKKARMTIDDYLRTKAVIGKTDADGNGLKNYEKARELLKMDLKSYTAAITSVITSSENQATGIQNCLNAGIKDRKVAEGYAKYAEINANEALNATQKATEFSKWLNTDSSMSGLTTAQKDMMRASFVYFMMTPASAGRYDNLMKLDGMSSAAAESISADIAKLEPKEGTKSVSDLQRLTAVAYNSTASEKQIDLAMQQILDSSDDGTDTAGLTKYRAIRAAGMSAKQYVDFRANTESITSDKDSNGKDIKGRTRQDKIWAYINSLPITSKQKDALHLVYYKESTLPKTPWH